MRSIETEADIQKALADRWRWLGTPGTLLAHIPNGETRDKAVARKLKAMGVLPGMPDLIVASPANGLSFLELKRRGGIVGKAQREVHDILRACGQKVEVREGLDDAVEYLLKMGILKG